MKIEKRYLSDGNIEFYSVVEKENTTFHVHNSICYDTTTGVFYWHFIPKTNEHTMEFLKELSETWKDVFIQK